MGLSGNDKAIAASNSGSMKPVSNSGGGSAPGSTTAPTGDGYLGAIATGVGSYFDYKAQQETNAAQAKEAEKNRKFQASQTGSAYERAAIDMRNAGLNPLLAAGGNGASSGSGAQAQFTAPQIGKGLANMSSSVMDSIRLKQDLAASDANIGLTNATAATQATQQALNTQNAVNAKANSEKIALENANIKTQQPALAKRAEADLKHATIDSEYASMDAVLKRTNVATGAVSNVMSSINPLKWLKGMSTPHQSPRAKGYTQENYSQQGEHMGTHVRKYNLD